MGNTQSNPSIDNLPMSKKSIHSNNSSQKKPFVGSFFDSQMVTPHRQATQPNRPPGHLNFFEIASATPQPTRSIKSSSSSKTSSRTPSSIIKSYPASISTPPISPTQSDPLPSNYRKVGQRKYWLGHGSQPFMMPMDEEESDRNVALHYILKAAFHGSFTAPVYQVLEKTKAKVLDLGCGTGTWTLEMASEFPNSEFYAIDDCPIFPTKIQLNNVHFKLHNLLKGLPYPDEEFDYVFMRSMIYQFTPDEMAQLLSEISRILKPGGYFEIIDTNHIIRRAGPISNKIVNCELRQSLYTILTSLSFTSQHDSNHPIFSYLLLTPQHESFMTHFIDITQDHRTLPIGTWEGGQMGSLHSSNFKSWLQSVVTKESPKPLSPQSIQDILDECERYKSFLDWYACYARKPPLASEPIEQSTLDSIYEFVEGFVDI